MDTSKLILKNLKGKAKVDRYWTKNSAGEKIQSEDISDEAGFYTTRLLSYKDMFADGKERRTAFYHAERNVNPASKSHKGTQSTKVDAKYSPRLGKYATQRKMNSTGHLKDL